MDEPPRDNSIALSVFVIVILDLICVNASDTSKKIKSGSQLFFNKLKKCVQHEHTF
jgi:hypothetical protein